MKEGEVAPLVCTNQYLVSFRFKRLSYFHVQLARLHVVIPSLNVNTRRQRGDNGGIPTLVELHIGPNGSSARFASGRPEAAQTAKPTRPNSASARRSTLSDLVDARGAPQMSLQRPGSAKGSQAGLGEYHGISYR
ncbi:hypothetical protein CYMTET_6328 [Cymbomonas tetramitiformis]|uniref:Uncharacterized protein n=1 Tax=Cymbomonas tetramitiformis TaxID=36881 RepID=A0AAE0LIK8_9CHLO|nr:hypothetical protein CYMTET_6328 [Cymbomonas tetramitiformis]